jgi:hypothetical protein
VKDSHPKSVEWRSRAEKLRAWGALDAARFWTLAADELEAWTEQHELEALPLAVAADESGYSASWLGKMISEGRVPNAGRPNAPMIRRGDLPRRLKPVARRPDGAPDLVGPVLAKQGLSVPDQDT